jgi:hypothetical protein
MFKFQTVCVDEFFVWTSYLEVWNKKVGLHYVPAEIHS